MKSVLVSSLQQMSNIMFDNEDNDEEINAPAFYLMETPTRNKHVCIKHFMWRMSTEFTMIKTLNLALG